MIPGLPLFLGGVLFAAQVASAVNFTVANGQIFTPGFAIVDAPQPGTPLGGGACLARWAFTPSPMHIQPVRMAD